MGRTDLEGAKPAGTATVMTAVLPPTAPRTPARKKSRTKDKKRKKVRVYLIFRRVFDPAESLNSRTCPKLRII